MNVLNLEFFDKFGESYNFKYNTKKGYWEGKEWLRETSVNLFDSINLFVLESNGTDFKFPRLNPGESLFFKWVDAKNENEFFMYDVIREDGTGNQFISKTNVTESKYSDFSNISAAYLPPITNITATTNGQNVAIAFKYVMATQWGVQWSLWNNSTGSGTASQTGVVNTELLNFSALAGGQYTLELRTESFLNPFSYALYRVQFNIDGFSAVTNGHLNTATINPLDVSLPMQVNIAFNPSEEKAYTRILEAYYKSGGVDVKVLELEFYGEGEEEDERFTVLSNNFGIKFNREDALILKDYDLKEGLPDFTQLNQIRKELLVSKDQIFPYVGTYKALANFINILGYKDVLRVKEYWQNRNSNSEYFNKMGLVDITDFLDDGQIDDFNLVDANKQIKLTNQFKKTSMLALVYEFTKTNGNYDEDGMPEIERTTEFTTDEIFFKLNKMGKKLKREILPINVQIKDIIGEFIFFQRYSMRYWTDRTDIEELEVSKHLDVRVLTPNLLAMGLTMHDINALYSKKNTFYEIESFNDYNINPFDNDQRYDPNHVQDLSKAIEDFYDAHINLSYTEPGKRPSWESYDEPSTKIGCPVILEAHMPDYSINSLDGVTVESMGLNRITVGTVKYANYYEVEWKIKKVGANPYRFEYRGPVAKLGKIPHILPSVGEYEIESRLYDVFGGVTYKFKKITVEAYVPVVLGVTRIEDKFDYTISNLGNVQVKDLDGSYVFNPRTIVLDNKADHKAIDIDKKLLDWHTYSNRFGFDKNMYDVEIEREDGTFESYHASTHPYKKYWGTAEDTYIPKISDYAGARVGDLFHSRLYDMSWQSDFQNGFSIPLANVDMLTYLIIGGYSGVRFPADASDPELLVKGMNALTDNGISDYTWSIVGDTLRAKAKFHGKQLHLPWSLYIGDR